MANSSQPAQQWIAKVFSCVLIYTGAAVFLLGDKFLHQFEHLNFFASEFIGILAGVLLMLLGAGADKAFKSPKAEQGND